MKCCTALLLALLITLCILPVPTNEAFAHAEETAEIQWYPIGHGNSLLYGNTDENGAPRGFVVYEDGRGNTQYGINTGTFSSIWDDVCIAVNRVDGVVDSIALNEYGIGIPYYSKEFFRNGIIAYCTYKDFMPYERYERQGDTYTMQQYNTSGMCWGGKVELYPEEVDPDWDMGYASIMLEVNEEKLENGLHVGTYLLTGVTDNGETVEILNLRTFANGDVEYTLYGRSWRYTYATGSYRKQY